MRILFMAQCYAPEEVSAAVLITELATDLVKHGHQVAVVTIAPNYPYGRVFPSYRNRIYQVERLDGVQVVRTWSYISHKKTFWRRIFLYGSYSATSFYGGLLAGKPDLLVNYSPPLPLGLTAWLLSRIWGLPWVLQLEDIYPDAAVAAGLLHNPGAITFFSRMERFIYQRTTHISLISESFRRNLLDKGISPDKITVIPNGADPDLIQPLPKENKFRDQHSLSRKFVVMYAGNIGLTSSLEDVINAAAQLREDQDVRFVIVGEGVKKHSLEQMAQEQQLDNILFLPYQSREAFPELLAAADLSLVTLNQNSSTASIPHKIFNIMASARPILAIAPLESEIAQLIDNNKCGLSIPPGHPVQLAEEIMLLKQESHGLAEMGQRGRQLLEAKFSREQCNDMFERMLVKVHKEKMLSL